MLTKEDVDSLIIIINRRMHEIYDQVINGRYITERNEYLLNRKEYNRLRKLSDNLYNLKVLFSSETTKDKFNAIPRLNYTTLSDELRNFYWDRRTDSLDLIVLL
jgi:hypothetical protein